MAKSGAIKHFILLEGLPEKLTLYRQHSFRAPDELPDVKLERGMILTLSGRSAEDASGKKKTFALADQEILVENVNGLEDKLSPISKKEAKELLTAVTTPEERFQLFRHKRLSGDQEEEQNLGNISHNEDAELTDKTIADPKNEHGNEWVKRTSSMVGTSLDENHSQETSFDSREEPTEKDQQINDLRSQVANLQKLLEAKDQRGANKHGQNTANDQKIADLERQVAELQRQLSLTAINKQVTNQRGQPTARDLSLQRRLSELQRQSATRDQQLVIQGLQNQLSSKNDEVDDLKNQLVQKEQQMTDLRNQMKARGSDSDLRRLLKQKDKRIDVLETQLREKEEQLAALQNQLRARTPRLPNLQGRATESRDQQVSNLQGELTVKDLQLADLRRQLSEKDQQLNDLQRQLTTRDQEVTDLERELRASERQVADLRRLVTARDQRITDLQRRLTTRDQQVIDLQRQLMEKDRQATNLERQLTDSNRHVNDLQRQLTEKERQLTDLERQLTARDQQVSDLQRQLTEKDQQVVNLQNQVTEKDQQVINLQRQLTARDQQRTHLQGQLAEKDRELAELQGQLRARSKQVRNLQGYLTEREQQISDLRRQLTASNQEVTDLQRQLRTRDEQVSDLEIQVNTRIVNEIDSPHTRETQLEHDWMINRNEIFLTDEELGKGAWGRVVRGKFRRSDVAVKEIYDVILSDYSRELFEREIGMASRCRHPCLLQFIGATNDDEGLLLVTEIMERSLRSLYEERPLTEIEVSVISLVVAQALNYLHKNAPNPIIHRRRRQ